MRIAALYDIHGNLPALEAVLDEVRAVSVDLIVVGGDVVPGPLVSETMQVLLELPVPTKFIRGNGELAVLECLAGHDPAAVPERYWPGIRWCAEQVAAHEQLLSSWPRTVEIEMKGLGRVLFCHATPRDENEIFIRTTDEARLRPIFDGLSADLVVCGHTHMQFDRMIGGTRVVNAGSVGMPFGEPVAHWLLLGETVEFRKTPYDLERAAARIRKSAHPETEEFVERYLLHPPTEAALLEAFARAEIKVNGLKA